MIIQFCAGNGGKGKEMDEAKKTEAMEVAIVFLAAIMMIPISLMIQGGMLLSSWRWFIEPLGAAPITYCHACGIVFVLLFLTIHKANPESYTFGAIMTILVFSPLRLLCLWGCLWFAHLWM